MPDDTHSSTWVAGGSTLLWLLESHSHGAPSAYPSRIGEYEILEVIGEGGNGVVLKARHPRTGALVALKIIRPDRCAPEGLKEFEVEWRTVLELKHRNIASVTDCGRYVSATGEAPFYVMELIDNGAGGRPLGLLDFARKKNLTIEQRVGLMIQVCGAVQTAHEKGVIHRDLKPGNIPVDQTDRSGDDGSQRLGVPKVVDFGLAHVLGAAIVEPGRATPSGQFAGTLRYMAPEQVRGATDEIGPWTDVHALGLIAFELLTGGFPYELGGLSEAGAIERIQTAPRAAAETLEPRTGRELSDLLGRAMDSSVRSRIQTAGELRRGLEAWLEGRRTRTGVARVARRHAKSLTVPLMLLASVLAAVAAMYGVAWIALDKLNLNAPFERWLCRLSPPRADQPFQDVRVVALDEAFNDQSKVEHVCRALGLERLSAYELGGLRPLYARVARLIVEKGGAPTVAIDIRFAGETPFDRDAANDMSAVNSGALGRAGPSIVVGMPSADFDPDTGFPKGMSPIIAKAAPFVGELTGQYEAETSWSVDLLVQLPDKAPAASLSAMTFAKAQGGAGTPMFSMGAMDQPARAMLGPSLGVANGRAVALPATRLESLDWDPDNARLGLPSQGWVDKMLIAMPSDRTLQSATVRLEDVVAAAGNGDEGRSHLWAWFHGKTIIIGDTRRTRTDDQETDMKQHASGREIAGVYALAVATQWLFDGRAIRSPGVTMEWALTWVMSAVGVSIVWLTARKRPQTGGRGPRWIMPVLGVLTTATAWVAGVFAAYYWGLWMISPWVPLSALLIGAALAFVLTRFGYAVLDGGRTTVAPA